MTDASAPALLLTIVSYFDAQDGNEDNNFGHATKVSIPAILTNIIDDIHSSMKDAFPEASIER